MSRLTQTRNRRGVTLLLVVSMIVLFLLMGTAFVVVSRDYLSTAVNRQEIRAKRDSGTALLQRAFYDLVRGPSLRNSTSPFRGHSLLADLYGYGFRARITNADMLTSKGNQLIAIQLADEIEQIRLPGSTNVITLSAQNTQQALTGHVITFLQGDLAGISARVVNHEINAATDENPTGHELWILLENPERIQEISESKFLTEILINGRALSGYGAAYDEDIDPLSGERPITNDVFLPNWRSLQDFLGTSPYQNYADGFLDAYATQNNSVNEPYDAFGVQDIFLAANGDVNGDANGHSR